MCRHLVLAHLSNRISTDRLNHYKMWLSGIKKNLTYFTTHIETKAMLELIASGRLDVESFVTNRLNLDEVPEEIKLYRQAGESFKQVIFAGFKK
jgi:threonine dehydrogenase-like Zn-dependent dehydrogenase